MNRLSAIADAPYASLVLPPIYPHTTERTNPPDRRVSSFGGQVGLGARTLQAV